MPYVKVVYSGDAAAAETLASALSKAASAGLGKPETYVMVKIEHCASLLFGGSTDPAAMVQIESVGGSLSTIIGPITDAVVSYGGIKADRVFVNFTSYDRSFWGMNGTTFG